MTKFDKETFATTSFLKEGGIGPVLLGLAEVVIIVKTLDMMLIKSSSRDNNKNDDEPHHSGLIT